MIEGKLINYRGKKKLMDGDVGKEAEKGRKKKKKTPKKQTAHLLPTAQTKCSPSEFWKPDGKSKLSKVGRVEGSE